MERAIGKNEKLESFMLESLKRSWKERSEAGKLLSKLESFAEVGKLWLKLELNEVSNFSQNFLTAAKLSNFAWLFPTSAILSNFRLSNLKLSNFSLFPTAFSNYTYPFSHLLLYVRKLTRYYLDSSDHDG